MNKIEIKYPKEAPECKDGTCGHQHEIELEVPTNSTIPKINPVVTQIPEPQIKEVVKVKKVVSSDQPFFECKNCDSLHKNPDYKDPPRKRCANGDCNTLNKSKAKGCKNCGSNEFDEDELTDEELEEIGIPVPEHDSHEGHEHDIE